MSFKGKAFIKIKTLRDPGMHLLPSSELSTRKVLSHLKYIGFRSRELDLDKDTKGLFNATEDKASLKKFYKSIKDEPGLKHSNTVKLHKVIISLKEEDYLKYGKDFKEISRVVMADLERRKGMKLEWVGAVHLKEGHPHAHLAIKSIGIDDGGNTRRLFLDKEDITSMRNEVDRFTGRDQYYSREKSLESNRVEHDFLKALSKEMDKLYKEGERETGKAKMKSEGQEKAKAEKDKKERDRER